MNGSMSSGELLKKVRYFALNYRKEENYTVSRYRGKEVKSFPVAEDAEIVMGNGVCSLLISSIIIGGSIDLGQKEVRANYDNENGVFEFNFMVYDDFVDHIHNYFESSDIFITMNFFIFKDNNDKKYIK